MSHAALEERNARLTDEDLETEETLNRLQEEFLSLFFRKMNLAIRRLVREVKKVGDAEDAVDRIVEAYRSEMGNRFPDAVYKDLADAMKKGWQAGHYPASTDWSHRPAPKQAIEWFAKANHFDIGKTFAGYADEIREAAIESLKTGDRKQALKDLEKRIPGVLHDERKRRQLGDIFRNLHNRAYTFGRVKSMESAGITRVEIVAVMDRRTSPICRVMNGKSFSIKTASRFIDDWLGTEYDEGFWGRFRQPNWEPTAEEVREAGSRNDALEKKIAPLRKLSGDELVKMLGIPIPPYHFRCRTTAVMAQE